MYIYNYVDLLGNVRVSYYKSSANVPTILEENNYHRFGLRQSVGCPENIYDAGEQGYSYKYNGKELQTDSGMLDYGGRLYMPEIGKWSSVDPLEEQSRRWSPYTYGNDNPIRFIDPDGRYITFFDNNKEYRYTGIGVQQQVDGEWVGVDNLNFSDSAVNIISSLFMLQMGGDTGNSLINHFDNAQNNIKIEATTNGSLYENGAAYIDFSQSTSNNPTFINLGHEMAHGMDPSPRDSPWLTYTKGVTGISKFMRRM